VTFHPVFYAIRPFYVCPKALNVLEIINFFAVMLSNYLIYTYVGPYALLYLLISGFIGVGLHPMAMHVIAEHYEFVKG
jgi:sphingolipid delta-4 desaturase